MVKLTNEQAEIIVNVFRHKKVYKTLGDYGESVLETIEHQLKEPDEKPYHKRYKDTFQNKALAIEMKKQGFSIRQIARKLNYKSPKSVQNLLS